MIPLQFMEERNYLVTWKKYLPVIRLHLKRSLSEDQNFKLNITDFESAGVNPESRAEELDLAAWGRLCKVIKIRAMGSAQ